VLDEVTNEIEDDGEVLARAFADELPTGEEAAVAVRPRQEQTDEI